MVLWFAFPRWLVMMSTFHVPVDHVNVFVSWLIFKFYLLLSLYTSYLPSWRSYTSYLHVLVPDVYLVRDFLSGLFDALPGHPLRDKAAIPRHREHRVGQSRFIVVSMQNTEFILALLFIIILFSIWATINPLLSHPVYVPHYSHRFLHAHLLF